MPDQQSTRRELLKSLGRYGALLGLLGGIGTLTARTACSKAPCSSCPLLSRCTLPKAQESRAPSTEKGPRT